MPEFVLLDIVRSFDLFERTSFERRTETELKMDRLKMDPALNYKHMSSLDTTKRCSSTE